jgi:hypothetical protein
MAASRKPLVVRRDTNKKYCTMHAENEIVSHLTKKFSSIFGAKTDE